MLAMILFLNDYECLLLGPICSMLQHTHTILDNILNKFCIFLSQFSHLQNKPKDMEGYVGFANLPNQVYRRSVKRGFEFTLMVVGKSMGMKIVVISQSIFQLLFSSFYLKLQSFSLKVL